MSNTNNPQEIRRKFIQWGGMSSLALVAAFSLRKFFFAKNSLLSKNDIIECGPPETRTLKMLTQDGVLVEVDASKIYAGKKSKITEEELKTWVGKKS